MADVGENGLHASGIGDVAKKGPVIHGHVAVKRIYDDFGSLRQRDVLLVPAPERCNGDSGAFIS